MTDKKSINILQLISSLEVGGAEKLLVDLLKNTGVTSGLDFTVVVMNDKVSEKLKEELLEAGQNVYFLGKKQGCKNPKYLFQLLNIIKKHQINIIHSHDYGSKSWSMLCKGLNPKIKLIFTAHCMNIFKALGKFNLFLHKKFIDTNIAISKAVLNDCKAYGILKTAQIYNGISIKNFSVNPNKADKNKDVLNIINVSRIDYQIKGQDVLIKALGECKNRGLKFKCKFVGGVYDYSKDSCEYLKKLVKELDLENEITFLGNRTDVADLLSQSDLFVLPSRQEGLGLVILEAMAAKVPVIASNIDGPAELIVNGQSGLLFECESHLDLAGKILYLYDNQEKIEDLVNKAYEGVQEFDISVMCEKYCRLYNELMGAQLG